ncbi:MAG TPA: NUDIX domain-containing protein [Chitinophagaceae bacterium]|nr:NUDIX domain-containing protein [Chitinophagaceae bacterium]
MPRTPPASAPAAPPDFDAEFLPGLAVDTVIFGFHERRLKVLLLRYRHTDLFALPGGFVRRTEDLDTAARRVLLERTGLTDIYLEQFHTFGSLERYNKGTMVQIMAAGGEPVPEDHFLLRRFVSVGYYALVEYTRAAPVPDALSDHCAWHDAATLPALMLDHGTMVAKALQTLRENLDRKLIGFNLLPETFTMGELQELYETVLGRPLLRTSFQRRMLALGQLERVAKKMTGGAHKAPYLYRFIS